jgi:hypothetical protein
MRSQFDKEDFIRTIKILFDMYPNQRIGQIIGNALPSNLNGDAYYVTDAELVKYLRTYMSKKLEALP